jgi:hypothetical protein
MHYALRKCVGGVVGTDDDRMFVKMALLDALQQNIDKCDGSVKD